MHDRFVTAVLDANGNQVFVNAAGNATGLSNAIYPLYNFNAAAWATPLTPEEYRSISTRVINEGVTTANQFSFTVNGDLMDMPAGPLGFAGTFEWADQSIDLESDPRTDPTRPVDASTPYNLRSSGRVVGDRSRIALGGELSVPVLDSLKLQLAARYDKYDDITEVDDAITYNLGVEWRPTDKLLVRGAYATSFRAPDMPLVFAEGAAGFTGAVDQLACRTAGFTPTQCGTSGNAGNVYSYTMQNATSGNPDLKEEEGESISFGFVYDFGNNLNMSVDYYRIDLSDAASVQSLALKPTAHSVLSPTVIRTRMRRTRPTASRFIHWCRVMRLWPAMPCSVKSAVSIWSIPAPSIRRSHQTPASTPPWVTSMKPNPQDSSAWISATH